MPLDDDTEFVNLLQRAGIPRAEVHREVVNESDLAVMKDYTKESYEKGDQFCSFVYIYAKGANRIRGPPSQAWFKQKKNPYIEPWPLENWNGRVLDSVVHNKPNSLIATVMYRTLVKNNFNTDEITDLLLLAYGRQATVHVFFMGKTRYWRLVLQAVPKHDSTVLNLIHMEFLSDIMRDLLNVSPTETNINRVLRGVGYIQEFSYETAIAVPRPPYLPAIEPLAKVLTALSVFGSLFVYNHSEKHNEERNEKHNEERNEERSEERNEERNEKRDQSSAGPHVYMNNSANLDNLDSVSLERLMMPIPALGLAIRAAISDTTSTAGGYGLDLKTKPGVEPVYEVRDDGQKYYWVPTRATERVSAQEPMLMIAAPPDENTVFTEAERQIFIQRLIATEPGMGEIVQKTQHRPNLGADQKARIIQWIKQINQETSWEVFIHSQELVNGARMLLKSGQPLGQAAAAIGPLLDVVEPKMGSVDVEFSQVRSITEELMAEHTSMLGDQRFEPSKEQIERAAELVDELKTEMDNNGGPVPIADIPELIDDIARIIDKTAEIMEDAAAEENGEGALPGPLPETPAGYMVRATDLEALLPGNKPAFVRGGRPRRRTEAEELVSEIMHTVHTMGVDNLEGFVAERIMQKAWNATHYAGEKVLYLASQAGGKVKYGAVSATEYARVFAHKARPLVEQTIEYIKALPHPSELILQDANPISAERVQAENTAAIASTKAVASEVSTFAVSQFKLLATELSTLEVMAAELLKDANPMPEDRVKAENAAAKRLIADLISGIGTGLGKVDTAIRSGIETISRHVTDFKSTDPNKGGHEWYEVYDDAWFDSHNTDEMIDELRHISTFLSAEEFEELNSWVSTQTVQKANQIGRFAPEIGLIEQAFYAAMDRGDSLIEASSTLVAIAKARWNGENAERSTPWERVADHPESLASLREVHDSWKYDNVSWRYKLYVHNFGLEEKLLAAQEDMRVAQFDLNPSHSPEDRLKILEDTKNLIPWINRALTAKSVFLKLTFTLSPWNSPPSWDALDSLRESLDNIHKRVTNLYIDDATIDKVLLELGNGSLEEADTALELALDIRHRVDDVYEDRKSQALMMRRFIGQSPEYVDSQLKLADSQIKLDRDSKLLNDRVSEIFEDYATIEMVKQKLAGKSAQEAAKALDAAADIKFRVKEVYDDPHSVALMTGRLFDNKDPWYVMNELNAARALIQNQIKHNHNAWSKLPSHLQHLTEGFEGTHEQALHHVDKILNGKVSPPPWQPSMNRGEQHLLEQQRTGVFTPVVAANADPVPRFASTTAPMGGPPAGFIA